MNNKNKKSKTLFTKLFFISLTLLIIFALAGTGYFAKKYLDVLSAELPSLEQLENYNPELVTKVYSKDGKLIKELFTQKRDLIPLNEIPLSIQNAILATEDRKFYGHWGIDIQRILGAAFINLVTLNFTQGASTLTQQLARNLYLTREKSIARKVKEILTSLQIEKTYSKKEILEMYLNTVYFGHGAYGIKSAAQKYFHKDVSQITIEEAALLASQLKAPTHYSPLFNPERALARRNTIISGMFEAGFISEKEKNTTTEIPILHKIRDVAEDDATYGEAPYFTEFVRQQLEKKQQTLGVNIYEDGLTVYTTLDSRLQACAERAIALQLPKVDKRAKTKDSTHVQVAFVALDHKTGEILAMVGGTDFLKTKFNRSVQAVRQPGSVFKSVLYTAAIDNGVPVCYEVLNQPVSILMADGTRWEPHNYEGTAGGLVTLREALKKSLNLVSVRLAVQRVVPPEVIIEYARRLGIQSPIEPYDAIALGATGILPIEAVAAYGTIANQGVYTTPTSIVKIEDKFGKILEQKNTESREALSVETTYLMTNLLEGVVNNGTAASLRSTFNFRRPAAGKTGTTNDFTDAWFIGFIPQMTAGVWVGFDDPKKTLGSGQTGGKVALPIWAEFIKCGCDTLQLSEERFEQPAGIVSVEICSETKELPTPYCQVETEIFNVKYLPQKTCSRHSGTKNKTVRKSGF